MEPNLDAHIADISRVIQLAVAPVFLLTAVATLITSMNNRLGRVIDRRRALTEKLKRSDEDKEQIEAELQLLTRRVKLVYYAILSAVGAALCVCMTVAGAFVGALFGVDLARTVAVFFIIAMCVLITCLSIFLREVFLAVTQGKPMLWRDSKR